MAGPRPSLFVLLLLAGGCARSALAELELDPDAAAPQGGNTARGGSENGQGAGGALGGTPAGGAAGTGAGGSARPDPCPPGLVGDDCDELAFEPLGRPPACRAGAFTPIDLSGDGRVVVGQCRYDVVSWTAEAGFRVLTLEAMPDSLNFDGSIVVGNLYAMNGDPHGVFRWTEDGIERLIDGPYYASGLSDDGATVIGTEVDRAVTFAFRLADGRARRLGVLPGRTRSVAAATDRSGRVVVGTSFDAAMAPRAFRWTADGTEDLGGAPGTTTSAALGVSADGTVVVGSSSEFASEGRAFRFELGSGMIDLGVLPGTTASSATDASADGSLVVGAACTSYNGRADSFVWDETRGLRALGDVLRQGGAELDGWSLGGRPWCLGAVAVSDDGRVVLGLGTDPDGVEIAYLGRLY